MQIKEKVGHGRFHERWATRGGGGSANIVKMNFLGFEITISHLQVKMLTKIFRCFLRFLVIYWKTKIKIVFCLQNHCLNVKISTRQVNRLEMRRRIECRKPFLTISRITTALPSKTPLFLTLPLVIRSVFTRSWISYMICTT